MFVWLCSFFPQSSLMKCHSSRSTSSGIIWRSFCLIKSLVVVNLFDRSEFQNRFPSAADDFDRYVSNAARNRFILAHFQALPSVNRRIAVVRLAEMIDKCHHMALAPNLPDGIMPPAWSRFKTAVDPFRHVRSAGWRLQTGRQWRARFRTLLGRGIIGQQNSYGAARSVVRLRDFVFATPQSIGTPASSTQHSGPDAPACGWHRRRKQTRLQRTRAEACRLHPPPSPSIGHREPF